MKLSPVGAKQKLMLVNENAIKCPLRNSLQRVAGFSFSCLGVRKQKKVWELQTIFFADQH